MISRVPMLFLLFGEHTYTQSLPEEAPYPEYALRGTSFPAVHSSTATHPLYLRTIISSSPTICALVECDKGINRAWNGCTKRLGVHGSVQAAWLTVCCILLGAHLSSRGLSKQTSCVSRHREDRSDVSKMAVAPSSKHFAGVGKVWFGTS
jgi:hypothetical protein